MKGRKGRREGRRVRAGRVGGAGEQISSGRKAKENHSVHPIQ